MLTIARLCLGVNRFLGEKGRNEGEREAPFPVCGRGRTPRGYFLCGQKVTKERRTGDTAAGHMGPALREMGDTAGDRKGRPYGRGEIRRVVEFCGEALPVADEASRKKGSVPICVTPTGV